MVGSEQRSEEAFEHSPRGVELLCAITMRLLRKQSTKEESSEADRRLRSSLD